MSDGGPTLKSRYWPFQGSYWWSTLLIASLALNLFIGGAVTTRFLTRDSPQRFIGASYTQLIPRRFFAEIPVERRKVLLDILRQYRKDFRADREGTETVAAKLADALMNEPYDVEKVKLVVSEFAGQSGKLAARGGDAALDIIALLSPDERKILADAIRDRASRGRDRKK
ncbi:MAG TPA: periplasmic heavy metal sensor [Aestuariivirga sp.]|nr:periplasmic heavy metal sensor [Aestuariivirga sp.]